MPELTEEQIKAEIAAGHIRAIAPETSIFDRYGCNLEFRVLAALAQFNGGDVRVLLSDVVRQEVRRHMIRDAGETQRALKSVLKQHARRWKEVGDPEAHHKALALDVEPATAADFQIEAFLKLTGAVVLPAEGDALAKEVLRRYFAPEPPFEKTEAKKSEFPDAYALLSIEADAGAAGTKTLCVSNDGGWQEFCKGSPHLVCVGELDKAISYFITTGRKTADDTLALWRSGAAADLDREVYDAFASELDGFDFNPDGSMAMNFEVEPISAVIETLHVAGASYPTIIAADDDEVTFTTKIDAEITFEAEFHAYVNEEGVIPLGNVTETATQTLSCEVVITVARDLQPEPQAISVEVRLPKVSVDFGHVDPFRDEDPTHEKY